MARTLYTGHVSVGDHQIYSFIYAETWSEAEEHLRSLLFNYVQQRFRPLSMVPFSVRVVSRPGGWEAPDGYYLPATSRQYTLKYHSQCTDRIVEEVDVDEEIDRPSIMPMP
jgi:hypothetical protein